MTCSFIEEVRLSASSLRNGHKGQKSWEAWMKKLGTVAIKKVQIGFLPGEEVDAYRCPPGWDLWSCNNLHLALSETDVIHTWFQIHREADLYKEDRSHLRWLRMHHPFDILMMARHKQYPSSQPLPVEELKKLWTLDSPPSFASSFSWMVAYAIFTGYKEINLLGIHLSTPREAYLEAPNLMAWCGIASAQGIRVTGQGRLFEPYLYGLEERIPPYWVPPDVARDLLIDQSLETRAQYREWDLARYYIGK